MYEKISQFNCFWSYPKGGLTMAGSIEERGKNKYRLVVSAGSGPDGKRKKHYKTIKATSPRAAEKELAKFIAEIENTKFLETSNVTLAEFINKWIEYSEANLSPKTSWEYKRILTNYVIPTLGHIKLEKLKPTHLQELYKQLQTDGVRGDGKPGGLSARTISNFHRVLSSVLESAVQWQLILINPAKRIKPPKYEKKQAAHYDEGQVFALLQALKGEQSKYQAIINLAIATGLRRGELLALEWSDIDFENNTLTVNKAYYYTPEKGSFTKSPKTETSKRVVSIPPAVVDILKEHKKQQTKNRLALGELWTQTNRIFTAYNGKPMFPDTISSWLPKFLKRNGLPHLSFHGLRHTAATLLIAQGIHAKTISSRLGHSNISTTMDIYGHALKSSDQEAAQKMDKFFTADIKREHV